MTEGLLRSRLGLFLIFAHLAIFLLVIGLYLAGGFEFPEMSTTVALISPMFFVYTTAIVKNFVAEKNRVMDRSRAVAPSFLMLSLTIPVAFVVVIAVCVVLAAYDRGFASFDEFKMTLAVIESAFAVYIGQFTASLFEQRDGAADRPRSQRKTEKEAQT